MCRASGVTLRMLHGVSRQPSGPRRAADLVIRTGFDLPVWCEAVDQSLVAAFEARG